MMRFATSTAQPLTGLLFAHSGNLLVWNASFFICPRVIGNSIIVQPLVNRVHPNLDHTLNRSYNAWILQTQHPLALPSHCGLHRPVYYVGFNLILAQNPFDHRHCYIISTYRLHPNQLNWSGRQFMADQWLGRFRRSKIDQILSALAALIHCRKVIYIKSLSQKFVGLLFA